MTGEQPTQGERLARVEEAMRGLVNSFDQLAKDLREDRATYLQRNEWAQHNTTLDYQFRELKMQVERMEVETKARENQRAAEEKSRRAPWWAIAAVVVAIGGILWDFVQVVLK